MFQQRWTLLFVAEEAQQIIAEHGAEVATVGDQGEKEECRSGHRNVFPERPLGVLVGFAPEVVHFYGHHEQHNDEHQRADVGVHTEDD